MATLRGAPTANEKVSFAALRAAARGYTNEIAEWCATGLDRATADPIPEGWPGRYFGRVPARSAKAARGRPAANGLAAATSRRVVGAARVHRGGIRNRGNGRRQAESGEGRENYLLHPESPSIVAGDMSGFSVQCVVSALRIIIPAAAIQLCAKRKGSQPIVCELPSPVVSCLTRSAVDLSRRCHGYIDDAWPFSTSPFFDSSAADATTCAAAAPVCWAAWPTLVMQFETSWPAP